MSQIPEAGRSSRKRSAPSPDSEAGLRAPKQVKAYEGAAPTKASPLEEALRERLGKKLPLKKDVLYIANLLESEPKAKELEEVLREIGATQSFCLEEVAGTDYWRLRLVQYIKDNDGRELKLFNLVTSLTKCNNHLAAAFAISCVARNNYTLRSKGKKGCNRDRYELNEETAKGGSDKSGLGPAEAEDILRHIFKKKFEGDERKLLIRWLAFTSKWMEASKRLDPNIDSHWTITAHKAELDRLSQHVATMSSSFKYRQSDLDASFVDLATGILAPSEIRKLLDGTPKDAGE